MLWREQHVRTSNLRLFICFQNRYVSNDGSFAGDVAIQCNLEPGANSHAQRVINGGNQPPVFPALDTRGLHTLAELCLRRADYEFCAQNVNLDNRESNNSKLQGKKLDRHDSFREPHKLHESKFKRRVSDSFADLRREQVKEQAKETGEEKCEDLKERRKQAVGRSINVSDDNSSSRLHKLEEELEKMLQ